MKHFLREEESIRQEENFEEFLNNFSLGGKVWINLNTLKSATEESKLDYDHQRRLVSSIMATKSAYTYLTVDKTSIISYLLDLEGVPESYLSNPKAKGLSIAESIRNKIIEDKMAEEFLCQYNYMSVSKNLWSRLKGITDKKELCKTNLVTDNGEPIAELYYKLNCLKNRRVSTTDYNVIGIPKNRAYIMEAPKGITFFEGDLPQADLRNAFNLLLKTPDTEKIFNSEEDAYKAFAKLVAKMNYKEFDEENFMENRNDYKAVTLGPLYGKVQAENPIQKEYVDSINKVLSTIPKYQKFKNNIISKKDAGFDIYSTSYFGYKQIVEASNHGFAGRGDILNSALNSPIQTSTSELVILITNSICKDFRDLGLVQGVDFGVLVVRYDEPIFWLRDELILDYSWVFKNHEKIIIDDFTPIPLEFQANKVYHVYNKEINELYNKSCDINKDKINTKLKEFTPSVDKYIPVMGTLNLALGYNRVDDGYICVLLDRENRRKFLKIKSEEKLSHEDIVTDIAGKLSKNTDSINEEMYDSLLIYNNYVDSVIGVDGSNLLLKFTTKPDSLVIEANHVAYVISYMSDLKQGKDVSEYDKEKLYRMSEVITPDGTNLVDMKFISKV